MRRIYVKIVFTIIQLGNPKKKVCCRVNNEGSEFSSRLNPIVCIMYRKQVGEPRKEATKAGQNPAGSITGYQAKIQSWKGSPHTENILA